MKRALLALSLSFWLAGCVTTSDDRFRDYNDDGIHLFREGNYHDARESFHEALKLRPDDPAVLYNIGECYYRMGNAGKAEQSYKECLFRAPNHAACRHSLAVLMMQQNRKAEAGKMIEDWLIREPKLAAAYAEDGWYWHQSGDLIRAQARLQQALEIDPHDLRALIELGQVYETMNRPGRALVLYERAVDKDPKQVELKSRIQFLLARGAGRPRPD